MFLFYWYDNVYTPGSQGGLVPGNIILPLLVDWYDVIIRYSGILAAVIGVVSISKEKKSNALNTLLSKPLYRDTVINGKLLGVMAFLACIIGLLGAIYVSITFIFLGDEISPSAWTFLEWIPILYVLSLICAAVFLLLSMLFSIIIKEQSFALFVSVLSCLVLVMYLPSVGFAADFSMAFGENRGLVEGLIKSLSPSSNIYEIISRVTDYDIPINVLMVYNSSIINAVIMLVILVVICYIAFMRRDVV